MNKKLFLTVLAVVSVTGMVMTQANAQTAAANQTVAAVSAPSEDVAVITWEKTSHDFGKIAQGKPVSTTYTFTNTGKTPLVIKSVRPSCGCTTDDYSKESIAPGKKGFVKLTFNAGSAGNFTKSTTVTANTKPELSVLTFRGEVLTNENASTATGK